MAEGDDGPQLAEDPTERVISEIMCERVRQVVAEHYRPAHDDTHELGELARAAASHTLRSVAALFPPENPHHGVAMHRSALLWPFAGAGLDTKDPRRHLVIAAALLVAEIERLDRAASRQAEGGNAT